MVTPERHAEAMDKIALLASVRERCRSEIQGRLAKADFSQEEIEDALSSAIRCGLISDERYTRAFIRGKTSLGWGRSRIVARLQKDNISDEVLEACEDEFSNPHEEYERAMHELERRSTRSSNPYASLMRRLVNKGYSYDIAKRAVGDFLSKDA